MQGIPGSGKSTETNKYPDAYIVSADHYFVGPDGSYQFDMSKLGAAHNQCKARFMVALRDKKPLIIVDNTNTTVKEFKSYVEEARTYGYEVEIIRIECDPEVAFKRGTHNVPRETVLKMANRLASSKLPEDYPQEIVIKTS
jgi:predicted kinase